MIGGGLGFVGLVVSGGGPPAPPPPPPPPPRAAYRMTILSEGRDGDRCRVVEYVTGAGKPLRELLLQPFDNVVLVSSVNGKDSDETLFQLPRTDSFLRSFAKMSYVADQALQGLLEDMERVARQRDSGVAPEELPRVRQPE
jgi:hypothetical protein